jgi:hypothetical protein
MLRRGRCPVVASRLAATPMLCARRSVSAEEQAEIEREAKLRQDFMKKKMEVAQSGSFMERMRAQAELAQAQMNAMQQQKQQGGGGGAGAGTPWGAGSGPGNVRTLSIGSMLWSSLIYSMALYLLIAVYYMRKPQSSFMSFQGIPQFAVPAEVTVAYLAVRILLSSSKQQELQKGYEAFSLTNPDYNFYQYLTAMQPNALQGVSTSQGEFLAALASVARGTGGMAWTSSMAKVSRFGDDAKRIDDAMANLRRDYGMHVAAPVGMGGGPAQSYGVPQGQQAYGYGGAHYNYGGGYPQQGQYYPQQGQQQLHQQSPKAPESA